MNFANGTRFCKYGPSQKLEIFWLEDDHKDDFEILLESPCTSYDIILQLSNSLPAAYRQKYFLQSLQNDKVSFIYFFDVVFCEQQRLVKKLNLSWNLLSDRKISLNIQIGLTVCIQKATLTLICFILQVLKSRTTTIFNGILHLKINIVLF